MGGPDIEEQQATPDEIEAIKISLEQWDRFEETGKPMASEYVQMATGYKVNEDGSLDIVENGLLNADGSTRTDTSGATAATEKAFAPAMSRVNPNSGQYQGGLNDLQAAKMQSGAESAAGTQLAQQNRQMAGMESAVSLARGEEASAVQGISQLADAANAKAGNDANNAFADASADRFLAGSLAGTAGGLYLGKKATTQGSGALTQLAGG